MSKEVEGKNTDEGPIAYINSAGKILECNLDFARLCGKQITQMIGRELTEQCKFDNPNALLEAAFQLDQLAGGSGDLWRAGFLTVLNTEDEYEVTVRRCARKIRHHSVMEAVVSKIHRSGSVGAGEAQRRESIRRSMKLEQKIALSEEVDSGHAKAEEKVGSGRYKSDGKDAKVGGAVLTPQKVLIVDDSPTARKMMAHLITRLGHIVHQAEDGLQALQLLQQERFDIVLMDINMPNMDGLEASHQFRMIEQQRRKSGSLHSPVHIPGGHHTPVSTSSHTPVHTSSHTPVHTPVHTDGEVSTPRSDVPHQKIIAMSANISNTLFTEVTNAGFDAFIPKPLTEEGFLEVLHMQPNQNL